MKKFWSEHQNLPWMIAIFLVAIILLLPGAIKAELALISPTNLGTDLLTKQWPNAAFITHAFKHTGEIPRWQPTTMGGRPLLGNPSMLILYPPYWLIFVSPITQAFTLYFILHLVLAGIGIYWFGKKSLGLSPQAAFIAGITYAFSAKVLAHLGGGHLDVIAAVAWFPWLLGALNRLARRPERTPIIIAATAIAAQALTHLPTLLCSSYIAGFWWFATFLKNSKNKTHKQQYKSIVCGLGVLILAFLLAAWHLLPMLEILPYSTRGSISLSESSDYALPPALLTGLFFPMSLAFPEWVVYLGNAVLLLAPASWIARKSFRGWGFLAALFITGLLFSLGTATPLYALLYRYLPGISWMRVPTRLFFFVQFSAALLAGAGWDAIQNTNPYKALTIWWIIYGFITLLGAGFTLLAPGIINVSISQFFITAVMSTFLIYSQKIAGTIFKPLSHNLIWMLLLFFEIGLLLPQFVSWKDIHYFTLPSSHTQFIAMQPGLSRSYSPNGISLIQAMSVSQSVSQSVSHDFEIINGADPFQFSHFQIWANATAGCDIEGYSIAIPVCAGNEIDPEAYIRAHPNKKLLGIGNVRYIISNFELSGWENPVWQQEEVRIYENSNNLPRAFVVSRVLRERNDTLALELLKAQEPSAIAVTPNFATQYTASINVINQEATNIVEIEPNHIIIKTMGPGWLVISTTWAPGWVADVDGIREQIYRTNVAFMGLTLSEGHHTVTLTYAPKGWQAGKLFSLFGILICVCVIILRPIHLSQLSRHIKQ